MKHTHIFSLLAAVLLSSAVDLRGQDQGINFLDADWKTALKEAEKQDKLIFVDCYTTWCGPCKQMARNVFTDPEVGSFYNKNFVNMKIDMEKGEGKEIAKKYEIRAYPSLLFVDASGKIAHKGIGSQPNDAFIQLGKDALNPDKRIGSFIAKYENGNREPQFLRQYAQALGKVRMSGTDKIAEEYLASQTDWTTEENLTFILGMTDFTKMDSKLFSYVSKNRKTFYELKSQIHIDNQLKYGPLYALRKVKNPSRDQVLESFKKVFPDGYARYADEYGIRQVIRSRDEEGQKKFFKLAVDFMEKYEVNDYQYLNMIAWRFYELTDDTRLLKKAHKWAQKSVDLNSNSANTDTLASICYKLTNKKDAIKYAKLSIELAQKEGRDPIETQKLLEKINALN